MSPGLVIDERTWSAWEAARLDRAQAARAKTAGPSHADVFLRALSGWKSAAYSACPDPGLWRADCPACGCDRTVTVVEFGERGPVALSCRMGCSQGVIVEALAAWRGVKDRDEEIASLEARIELLEAVVDRLCDHIASEVVA